MDQTVKNVGEKFIFQGQLLTASGFFGSSGVEFPTAKEAYKANPTDKFICVKNKEFGGATDIRESFLQIQIIEL